MNHEDLRDLYMLYALGLLDGEERDEIERHLAENCEVCAAGLRLAAEANGGILKSAEMRNPPAGLRRKVLAAFGAPEPFWRRYAPWVLALGAVTLAIGVTLRVNRPESRQASRVLEFLSQPGSRQIVFGGQPGAPRGSMYLHRQNGVLLLVDQIPSAPPGQMYETWYIPKAGAPQPTGRLETGKNGSAVAIISRPIDPAAVSAVAVSLEPDTKEPVSPTTVVFAAPLSP